MTARQLMQEFRLNCGGDAWGETRGWWFAVAGEMDDRGLAVPDEWRYRPSPMGGVNPDAYETPFCAEASDEALLLFGRAMNRYAGILKRSGKDY